MPIYSYRCERCGVDVDHLQPLGAPPPVDGCAACGGPLRKRPARVAVRYGTWGFSATDGLVRDTRGRDYKDLRERAERISEGYG